MLQKICKKWVYKIYLVGILETFHVGYGYCEMLGLIYREM